jgi:hypothetical protein
VSGEELFNLWKQANEESEPVPMIADWSEMDSQYRVIWDLFAKKVRESFT